MIEWYSPISSTILLVKCFCKMVGLALKYAMWFDVLFVFTHYRLNHYLLMFYVPKPNYPIHVSHVPEAPKYKHLLNRTFNNWNPFRAEYFCFTGFNRLSFQCIHVTNTFSTLICFITFEQAFNWIANNHNTNIRSSEFVSSNTRCWVLVLWSFELIFKLAFVKKNGLKFGKPLITVRMSPKSQLSNLEHFN